MIYDLRSNHGGASHSHFDVGRSMLVRQSRTAGFSVRCFALALILSSVFCLLNSVHAQPVLSGVTWSTNNGTARLTVDLDDNLAVNGTPIGSGIFTGYPAGAGNTINSSPNLTGSFLTNSTIDHSTNLFVGNVRNSTFTNASRGFALNVQDTDAGAGEGSSAPGVTGIALGYARGSYDMGEGFPHARNILIDDDHTAFPYVVGSQVSTHQGGSYDYVYNSTVIEGDNNKVGYIWGGYMEDCYGGFQGYIWQSSLKDVISTFIGRIYNNNLTNIFNSFIGSVDDNSLRTEGLAQSLNGATILNPNFVYVHASDKITIMGRSSGNFVTCQSLLVGNVDNLNLTNMPNYTVALNGNGANLQGVQLSYPDNDGWTEANWADGWHQDAAFNYQATLIPSLHKSSDVSDHVIFSGFSLDGANGDFWRIGFNNIWTNFLTGFYCDTSAIYDSTATTQETLDSGSFPVGVWSDGGGSGRWNLGSMVTNTTQRVEADRLRANLVEGTLIHAGRVLSDGPISAPSGTFSAQNEGDSPVSVRGPGLESLDVTPTATNVTISVTNPDDLGVMRLVGQGGMELGVMSGGNFVKVGSIDYLGNALTVSQIASGFHLHSSGGYDDWVTGDPFYQHLMMITDTNRLAFSATFAADRIVATNGFSGSGAGLTSIPAAAITHSVTRTNWGSGFYTNTSGALRTFYTDEVTTSAASGVIGFQVLYDPTGGHTWETNCDGSTVAVGLSIVGMTGRQRLSGPWASGGVIQFTNVSTVGTATLANGYFAN